MEEKFMNYNFLQPITVCAVRGKGVGGGGVYKFDIN